MQRNIFQSTPRREVDEDGKAFAKAIALQVDTPDQEDGQSEQTFTIRERIGYQSFVPHEGGGGHWVWTSPPDMQTGYRGSFSELVEVFTKAAHRLLSGDDRHLLAAKLTRHPDLEWKPETEGGSYHRNGNHFEFRAHKDLGTQVHQIMNALSSASYERHFSRRMFRHALAREGFGLGPGLEEQLDQHIDSLQLHHPSIAASLRDAKVAVSTIRPDQGNLEDTLRTQIDVIRDPGDAIEVLEAALEALRSANELPFELGADMVPVQYLPDDADDEPELSEFGKALAALGDRIQVPEGMGMEVDNEDSTNSAEEE